MKINVKIKTGIILFLISSLLLTACKEKQQAEVKYGLLNDSVNKVVDKTEKTVNNKEEQLSENTKAVNEKTTDTIYGMKDIN